MVSVRVRSKMPPKAQRERLEGLSQPMNKSSPFREASAAMRSQALETLDTVASSSRLVLLTAWAAHTLALSKGKSTFT